MQTYVYVREEEGEGRGEGDRHRETSTYIVTVYHPLALWLGQQMFLECSRSLDVLSVTGRAQGAWILNDLLHH